MDTLLTSPQSSPRAFPDCVEIGEWTKVPEPPPAKLTFKLKEVDQKESQVVKDRGVMTFHAVGCTGCHADQQATAKVASAMAVQVVHPHRFAGIPEAVPASFLYHLGDVVYKKDKDTASNIQISCSPRTLTTTSALPTLTGTAGKSPISLWAAAVTSPWSNCPNRVRRTRTPGSQGRVRKWSFPPD
jgi:hypothetical protein